MLVPFSWLMAISNELGSETVDTMQRIRVGVKQIRLNEI